MVAGTDLQLWQSYCVPLANLETIHKRPRISLRTSPSENDLPNKKPLMAENPVWYKGALVNQQVRAYKNIQQGSRISGLFLGYHSDTINIVGANVGVKNFFLSVCY